MKQPLTRSQTRVLSAVTLLLSLATASSALAAPPPARPTTSVDDPDRARALYEEGTRLMQSAEFDDACAAFRGAAAASPLWALARFQYAQCLRIRGISGDIDPMAELSEAERTIQKPVLHIERARLQEDRGQPAAAFVSWMRALEMMPSEIRALEGAARTASALPRPQGAIVERERITAWLARQPHDVAAWVRLGELAELRGDLVEAERAFIEAGQRSVNPRRGAALIGLFAARSGSRVAADKAQQLLNKRK